MVNIYLVRHGKTMFNTIGRAQGWSDTPLTAAGEQGIIELGLDSKKKALNLTELIHLILDVQSRQWVLSWLILIMKEFHTLMIKRIREWCFGSFDGGYDGELLMVFYQEYLPKLEIIIPTNFLQMK